MQQKSQSVTHTRPWVQFLVLEKKLVGNCRKPSKGSVDAHGPTPSPSAVPRLRPTCGAGRAPVEKDLPHGLRAGISGSQPVLQAVRAACHPREDSGDDTCDPRAGRTVGTSALPG